MALLPLGFIGLASEAFWRAGTLRGEGGRKFVHILSGIWIAFWPFFLSFKAIAALGILLFVGLVISRNIQLFHAVYDVRRRTFGEYFYPLAITLSAFMSERVWQFTAMILLMAVADGFAAVIGTRYEKIARPYKIFLSKKSMLGTAVYFGFAFLILGELGVAWAGQLTIIQAFGIASLATMLENILPYGSDNLVIPVCLLILL